MENSNKPEDLKILVKAKKRPKFKAGSELAGSVNRLEVNVDQDITEDSETITLEVKLMN